MYVDGMPVGQVAWEEACEERPSCGLTGPLELGCRWTYAGLAYASDACLSWSVRKEDCEGESVQQCLVKKPFWPAGKSV